MKMASRPRGGSSGSALSPSPTTPVLLALGGSPQNRHSLVSPASPPTTGEHCTPKSAKTLQRKAIRTMEKVEVRKSKRKFPINPHRKVGICSLGCNQRFTLRSFNAHSLPFDLRVGRCFRNKKFAHEIDSQERGKIVKATTTSRFEISARTPPTSRLLQTASKWSNGCNWGLKTRQQNRLGHL